MSMNSPPAFARTLAALVASAICAGAFLWASTWRGRIGGLVVLGLGGLALAAQSRPVRRLFGRAAAPSASHAGMALVGALFLLGLASFAGALFVPSIDGTVRSHYAGKGRSYFLTVDGASRTNDVMGNTDVERCPDGARLSKPAWSTAYRCDDRLVPSASVGVYPVVAIELLLATACLAYVLLRLARR
jgi:hypothetical protein